MRVRASDFLSFARSKTPRYRSLSIFRSRAHPSEAAMTGPARASRLVSCAKLSIFLVRIAASSATEAKKPMTPELQRALRRHTQWFGSYKASGELKKIHVWLLVNGG